MAAPASNPFNAWAETYDHTPNPLLRLEERVLGPVLEPLHPRFALDLACGTGRWLAYWRARGIPAAGADFAPQMLARAASKGLAGRLLQADGARLPFSAACFDCITCCFALSYMRDPEAAFEEAARTLEPGGTLILSDLHPRAAAQGWKRSFASPQGPIVLDAAPHPENRLTAAASAAGLRLWSRREASFGEPERPVFEAAGRAAWWRPLKGSPAILILAWRIAAY